MQNNYIIVVKIVVQFTVIFQLPYSLDIFKIKKITIEKLLLEMSGMATRSSPMGRFRPKMDPVKVSNQKSNDRYIHQFFLKNFK